MHNVTPILPSQIVKSLQYKDAIQENLNWKLGSSFQEIELTGFVPAYQYWCAHGIKARKLTWNRLTLSRREAIWYGEVAIMESPKLSANDS